MISSVARSLLARSTLTTRASYVLGARFSVPNGLHNTVVAFARPGRYFSVSAPLGSPTAATTKKSTTTKKKPAVRKTSTARKTTTIKKKTTARASAAKKTTATKKKVAPKKRKVAAKKKVIVKKRVKKVKKVVPKKVTPKNEPKLRAPPRSLGAFSLYVRRMYPSLTPKPANAMEGMAHIRTMWKAMNAQEKQPFEQEAAALSAERRATYNKWRSGLSVGDVRLINAYRANTKHRKLGSRTGPKKTPTAYVKFYTEKLADGTIDPSKRPEGTQFVVYASSEASRLWKTMSDAEKSAYKS